MPTSTNPDTTSKPDLGNNGGPMLSFRIGQLIFVLFAFMVALDLMSGSFKLFGKDFANELVSVTTNPFISLFIGMLATAIIQSSSTTTTMIVGLVASGSIGVPEAAPMIMGANIGTSVTSTIVSLGHIGDRDEYPKAVAAATVHDFFNIITVSVLFTLEVTTGILSSSAQSMADFFYSTAGEGGKTKGILDYTTKAFAKWIIGLTATEGYPGGSPFITLPIALGLLFFSLRGLTKSLKDLIIGRVEKNLNKYVFGNGLKAILWGFGITTAVQSSSVTSSLMVPMVASEKITLRKAFPFLMGANIGTTTTALIAAFFLGSQSTDALAIAFVHFFFNAIGVLILYPIPIVREIPVFLATGLGNLTLKNRLIGIIYVVVVFFIIPGILIFLTRS